MRFADVPKPVTSLWDDYLAYIINPPAPHTNEYKKQKIIFFSSIVMYTEYLQFRFPPKKGSLTPKEKKKLEVEWKEIYDSAKRVVENFVQGEGVDLGDEK